MAATIRPLPQSPAQPAETVSTLAQAAKESVFSVIVHSRSNGQWSGTAWIAEKEDLGNGRYRYWAVSNAHVANSPEDDEISFEFVDANNSERFDVKRWAVDHEYDLALFQFESSSDYPALQRSDKPVQIGESIFILGNQDGNGIVLSSGSTNGVDIFRGLYRIPHIEHFTNSTHGNSGSPMFDSEGHVIAIEHAGNAKVDSIGFAIPVSLLNKCLKPMKEQHNCPHGTKLSVERLFTRDYTPGAELEPRDLEALGIDDITYSAGYYLDGVLSGSVAARAGLHSGDIILSVNGEPLPPYNNWQRIDYTLLQQQPNEPVVFEVVTVAEPTHIKRIEYPYEASHATERATATTGLGFSFVELDPQSAAVLKATHPDFQGGMAMIYPSDKQENSPLHGAIVSKLNDSDVHSIRDVDLEPKDYRLPLVATVHGTGEQLPLGQTARVLLNDFDAERVEKMWGIDAEVVELNEEECKALGIEGDAFYVTKTLRTQFHEENEALFVGDIITGFNKSTSLFDQDSYMPILRFIPLSHELGLASFLKNCAKGEKFTLHLQRNGQALDVARVRVKQEPLTNPFSFDAVAIDENVRKNLGLPADAQGIFITYADLANDKPHPLGLKSGMIVTSVAGKIPHNPEEFMEIVRSEKDKGNVIAMEVRGHKQWQDPNFRNILFIDAFAL